VYARIFVAELTLWGMIERRKVLLGIGTSVILSGCGGNSRRSTDTTTPTRTATPTDTPEPANFKIRDTSPRRTKIKSKEIELSATVENIGEQTANKEVQLVFEGETIHTEIISLEPGSETSITTTVDDLDLNYTEYTYEFRTENSGLGYTFRTYTDPVKQPTNVPEYTIEEREDVSVGEVERVEYNILSYVSEEDRYLIDLSVDDLLDICRDIILDVAPTSDLNAIGFNFWREAQTIGAEQAQAVIDWSPNGKWSEAGSVKSGDYSKHEFSVNGLHYIEVIDLNGPEVVEANEPFRIEWILKNKGFASTEFHGLIENLDDEVLKNFSVQLDINEESTISITDELSGLDYLDRYSLISQQRGIHGISSISVDVK